MHKLQKLKHKRIIHSGASSLTWKILGIIYNYINTQEISHRSQSLVLYMISAFQY